MPKASLKTFASGARQFRGAGGVGDDDVGLGVVDLFVDAHDDRRVLARGGSGDQDLLRATRDVLLGVIRLREAAGGLDDDVDAEVAPGQVRGVALGEHGDALAANRDRVTVVRDLFAQLSADGVVLEEVREGLVVGEIVHRHDLEVRTLRECRAEVVASDPAEAVDADLDSHGVSRFLSRECAL